MKKLAYIFCIAINLIVIAGCEHILPYNQGTNLLNEQNYKSAIPYLKQAIQMVAQ